MHLRCLPGAAAAAEPSCRRTWPGAETLLGGAYSARPTAATAEWNQEAGGGWLGPSPPADGGGAGAASSVAAATTPPRRWRRAKPTGAVAMCGCALQGA